MDAEANGSKFLYLETERENDKAKVAKCEQLMNLAKGYREFPCTVLVFLYVENGIKIKFLPPPKIKKIGRILVQICCC